MNKREYLKAKGRSMAHALMSITWRRDSDAGKDGKGTKA
jgi:hypothetical protein